MTSNQGEHLSVLVSAATAITEQTLAGFGDLTAQWKLSSLLVNCTPILALPIATRLRIMLKTRIAYL
jgi:hypothetical protein